MEFNKKSIILIFALSSLLSLHNVEATSRSPSSSPDPSIERVCSQTEFRSQCITTVSTYLSGVVNGNLALRAGLQDLIDGTLKAVAEVGKLKKFAKDHKAEEGLSATLACYGKVLNSSKKAVEAILAKDYVSLKRELDVAADVIGELEEDDKKSYLNEVTKLLSKVANNNLDILVNVVKPSSLDVEVIHVINSSRKDDKDHKEEKEEEEDDDEDKEDDDEDEEDDDDDDDDDGDDDDDDDDGDDDDDDDDDDEDDDIDNDKDDGDDEDNKKKAKVTMKEDKKQKGNKKQEGGES